MICTHVLRASSRSQGSRHRGDCVSCRDIGGPDGVSVHRGVIKQRKRVTGGHILGQGGAVGIRVQLAGISAPDDREHLGEIGAD